MAKHLLWLLFRDSTISIITPMRQASMPYSKKVLQKSTFCCSKKVEVRCSCSELKPYQREMATGEIQERKNYRKRSNIKSMCVSALTGSGSVPCEMAEGL